VHCCGEVVIEIGKGWELRSGPYQIALDNVASVDVVITDTPYSARTHKGHDRAVAQTNVGDDPIDDSERRAITYAAWDASDVDTFAQLWGERCKGWICAMSDNVLAEPWRTSLEEQGRCGFAPLPCVIPGMTVRLQGDGPSSWCVWLNVARPRREPYSKWGTLPGEYRATSDRGHIGGKPLAMMRAIVRDYSKRGDLICDPCAGWATTGLAALLEGRRFIGAEADPDTFRKAVARLRKGYTPTFDFG